MKILLSLAFITTAAAAATLSIDTTLRDEARAKDIECRVHYPETGDRLPLIVFSHGFGSDRTAFSPIAQHWAEHGFIVVNPSHIDGYGKSLGKGDATPKGGIQGLLERAGRNIATRVRDITFVLDSLDQLAVKLPDLEKRLDRSRIGVGGHSLGAYTAMLIGGVTTNFDGTKSRDFRDPRVHCVMPISAQGIGQQGLTESSWANLHVPMLTITGSRDTGAGGQKPEWRMTSFKLSPPGDKYLLYIEGATHGSYDGGPGESGTRTTDVVKVTTLAFWNAYLKDDMRRQASLKSGSVLEPFGAAATIEAK
jgi:predicted dienelactone hydrolase